MDEQRNFSETTFSAICALNSLLQDNAICRDPRAFMKINRFKRWLLDYTEQTK